MKQKTKITLVENGIFPITTDVNGNRIQGKLDTGLNESGTVQGEGKLLGIPSLFIRTSGCNLRCAWRMDDGTSSICDTAFSSWNPEKNIMEIDDIITIVRNNIGACKHIVISGGEPLLQYKELAELQFKLKKVLNLHVTLETNATIFDADVANSTDLISMSPKLSTSTPMQTNLRGTDVEYVERIALRHDKLRYNVDVIQAWVDACYGLDATLLSAEKSKKRYQERLKNKDFQLKFVVSNNADIDEIKNKYLRILQGVNPEDVVLMPLGLNQDQLSMTTMLVLRACIQNGWRYTPRLHIDMFNDKRSV